jgi:hypothetical protein
MFSSQDADFLPQPSSEMMNQTKDHFTPADRKCVQTQLLPANTLVYTDPEFYTRRKITRQTYHRRSGC